VSVGPGPRGGRRLPGAPRLFRLRLVNPGLNVR